uniref:Uncharacterized protein n=1 Tax=Lactuca sativa TaxID=4236 RepID=A0A9R1VMD1_LACSA|nr:hypothetical protein LSAT_V11C400213490 [Lactuca sativa]
MLHSGLLNLHFLGPMSTPYIHHLIVPDGPTCLMRRKPDRPCVKRKRDQAENELNENIRHTISRTGVQHRCTIHNETRHNKATCPMRGPSEASPSKPRKRSNTKNCPSQAGPSTLAPSTPIHVNQDPMTQEHNVPCESRSCKSSTVNQDHVNQVPVKQVPANLGVRVPKSLENQQDTNQEASFRKDGKGVTEDNPFTLE